MIMNIPKNPPPTKELKQNANAPMSEFNKNKKTKITQKWNHKGKSKVSGIQFEFQNVETWRR